MMTDPSWIYNNEIFDPASHPIDDYAGFIYCITNHLDGRKYIGKKTLWSIRRVERVVQLKNGTKKKKKITKKSESDWKTYWSSSNELQSDVELLGSHNFSREILRFCKTKAEMSYYETKYQLELDVLIQPDLWYNSFASCRINRSHLKHLIIS